MFGLDSNAYVYITFEFVFFSFEAHFWICVTYNILFFIIFRTPRR